MNSTTKSSNNIGNIMTIIIQFLNLFIKLYINTVLMIEIYERIFNCAVGPYFLSENSLLLYCISWLMKSPFKINYYI